MIGSKHAYTSTEQVPTKATTVAEIMTCPFFARGAADVRAGRGYSPDYDLWPHTNHRWNYERGRMWAVGTSRNVPLLRSGKPTAEAVAWFGRLALIIL